MNMKCTVGKAETSFQKNPSPTKTVKKDVNKKVEDIKFKKRAKKHYKHRKNRSNKFSENMNLVVKKVTRYE